MTLTDLGSRLEALREGVREEANVDDALGADAPYVNESMREVEKDLDEIIALAEEEHIRSYLAGLWEFAWWKDGTAYVGTTGTTFKQAAERFLTERGKTVAPDLYGYGRRSG